MQDVGGIYADLSLRIGRFNQGLREATKSVQEASKEIQKSMEQGMTQGARQGSKVTLQELRKVYRAVTSTSRHTQTSFTQSFTAMQTSSRTARESILAALRAIYRSARTTGVHMQREFAKAFSMGTTLSSAFREAVLQNLRAIYRSATMLGTHMRRVLGPGFHVQVPVQPTLAALRQIYRAISLTGPHMTRHFGRAFTVVTTAARTMQNGVLQVLRDIYRATGTTARFIHTAFNAAITKTIQGFTTFKQPALAAFRGIYRAATSTSTHLISTFTNATRVIHDRMVGVGSHLLGPLRDVFKGVSAVSRAFDQLSGSIAHASEFLQGQLRMIASETRQTSAALQQMSTIPISDEQFAAVKKTVQKASTSIKRTIKTVGTTVQTVVTNAHQVTTTTIQQIVTAVTMAGQTIKQSIMGISPAIQQAAQTAGIITTAMQQAQVAAQEFGTQAVVSAQEASGAFASAAKESGTAFKQSMKRVADSTKDSAEKAKKATTTAAKETKKAVKTTAKESGRAVERTAKGAEKATQRATWVIRGYIKDTARVITGILIARTFYMLLKRIEQTIGAAYELKQAFEEAAMSFKYLMNIGQDAAREFAERMRYWALDTEFSIAQVTQGFREMFIAGVELEHIDSVMQTLIGTSTAYRMDLEELIGTMKRVRATPIVTTSTMRQLERAGIEVLPMIREQLGLTAEELTTINQLAIPGEVMFRALLQGFSKYSDAAQEGATTLRARWSDMMEVIQDSLGILTTRLYDAWAKTIGGMLEWVAKLREGLLAFGPRALVLLFPPRMRRDIEMVISSLRSLWFDIRRVASALSGIFRDAFLVVFRVLAQVIPMIAMAVRAISNLVVRVLTAAPAVRFLAITLSALTIAYTAAAAIRFLVTWILKLRIVVGVGKLIKFLGLAFAFAAKNAFLLAAAIMLLLSLFGRVKGSLAGIGKAISDMFPAFEPWGDGVEEGPDFSGAFEGLEDDMEDAAEGTGKAADEMEDLKDAVEDVEDAFKPFLAAFDEVYTIPDQGDDLDDALKGLDDVLDDLKGTGEEAFEWPEIPWPEVDIPSDLPQFHDLIGSIGEDLEIGFDNLMDTLEGFADFFEGWKGWLAAALLLIGHLLTKKLMAWLLGLPALLWTSMKLAFAKLVQWFWNIAVPWFLGLPKLLSKKVWIPLLAWAKRTFTLKNISLMLKGAWAAIKLWAAKTFTVANLMVALGFLKKALLAIPIKGWIAAAIIGALLGIYAIFKKWGPQISEWFREQVIDRLADTWAKLGEGWDALGIGDMFRRGWGTLVEWFSTNIVDPLVNTWRGVYDGFKEVADWFKDNIIEPLVDAWKWGKNTLGAIFGTIFEVAGYVWEDIKSIAKSVWYVISKNLSETWDNIKRMFVETWENYIQAGFIVLVGIWEGLVKTWDWIRNNLRTIWNNIRSHATSVWENTIAPIFTWLKEKVWEPLVQWWEDTKDDLGGYWDTIKSKAKEVWEDNIAPIFTWLQEEVWEPIVDTWVTIRNELSRTWEAIKTTASNVWRDIGRTFRNAINGIIDMLNRLIDAWNNLTLSVPTMSLPGGGTIGGWSVGTQRIQRIPRLARGGIVTRDTLAQVGEGGTREAVIPLNRQSLQPFAEALVDALRDQDDVGGRGASDLPPLYVGTLIADRQGLRELERKMKVIRLEEAARGAQ